MPDQLKHEVKRMNYETARSVIKSGDIVFFSGGSKNIVRHAITWFTRGELYHVGIAFWAEFENGSRRLMLAEGQPDGHRIINLSAYKDRDMTIVRIPQVWERVSESVLEEAGNLKYDLYDLLLIGLHERFGLPIDEKMGGHGDVCSVAVSKAIQKAGVTGIETMVSPQRLFDQLTSQFGAPIAAVSNE